MNKPNNDNAMKKTKTNKKHVKASQQKETGVEGIPVRNEEWWKREQK